MFESTKTQIKFISANFGEGLLAELGDGSWGLNPVVLPNFCGGLLAELGDGFGDLNPVVLPNFGEGLLVAPLEDLPQLMGRPLVAVRPEVARLEVLAGQVLNSEFPSREQEQDHLSLCSKPDF